MKIARLSEKFLLMPGNLAWWVWTAMAVSLAAGLSGYSWGFHTAVVISVVQAIVYDFKDGTAFSFPVQIRFGFAALLIACQLPFLKWLYWLPAVGTFALVLFGYCLMARVLSLLPWNRREPMSLNLVRRTFFTPPAVGNVHHGLPASDCPGGRRVLEAGSQHFLPAHGQKIQTNQTTANQDHEHCN